MENELAYMFGNTVSGLDKKVAIESVVAIGCAFDKVNRTFRRAEPVNRAPAYEATYSNAAPEKGRLVQESERAYALV